MKLNRTNASTQRWCNTRNVVASLTVLGTLTACGGGGGGGGSDSASSGSTSTPSVSTPGGSTLALQSHLANCPNTLALNQAVPCMAGQYQGTRVDNGAACSFVYEADGTATYTAAGRALQGRLDPLTAVAVFEKKAASSAAGFSISWAVGSPSGQNMHVYYQLSSQPASANGLLIKPDDASVPACLVQAAPAAPATASGSTANALGRTWQSPQMLNGSAGAVGLFSDQPAFDVGMADDGRAFIAFRQPDANGRMAVHVVDGRPGAPGQPASWSQPQVLDGDAPLLAGNFRPRLAVSSTGHAVVSWLTQRPCEADAVYEANPTGKTCRYFYASRRLASETAWEAPQRVRASPVMASQDHFARINAQGDVLLVFPSFNPLFVGSTSTSTTLALRPVASAAYQAVGLSGFWSNQVSTTPFENTVKAELDDAGNVFVAGDASDPFDIAQLRTTATLAVASSYGNNLPVVSSDGTFVYDLRRGAAGFAAHIWRESSGSQRKPEKLSVYSPVSQAWRTNYDIRGFTQWGYTDLVGTDNADGEFLIYSGCKLTAWRAGTWGPTRDLPAYCGRDQSGGSYAFNRKGDYVGINWAGRPGQWGYYSYAQDRMLKGAPGDGTAAPGDLVLGTASGLFGAQPTQLLLADNGLALAVTTNTYARLPSAADPAVAPAGASAKLWAVYLK